LSVPAFAIATPVVPSLVLLTEPANSTEAPLLIARLAPAVLIAGSNVGLNMTAPVWTLTDLPFQSILPESVILWPFCDKLMMLVSVWKRRLAEMVWSLLLVPCAERRAFPVLPPSRTSVPL